MSTKTQAMHTPGPWYLAHSGFANTPFVIFSGTKHPDFRNRFPLSGVHAIAEIFHDEGPDHEQQEADARLIAAAPEMLELLKELVSQLENTCTSDIESGDACVVSVGPAKRIIAKATGRTA